GTGEKALVFVEDLAVQRAFAEAMATVFDLEKIPGVINGAVAGERRQDIVKRFQEARPGFDLLLLSPKAAGVGLTITAANHVLHLSRWWNPAVEDQCNDRAYRIGQTRDVTIHVPLALQPNLRGSILRRETRRASWEKTRAFTRYARASGRGWRSLRTIYGRYHVRLIRSPVLTTKKPQYQHPVERLREHGRSMSRGSRTRCTTPGAALRSSLPSWN